MRVWKSIISSMALTACAASPGLPAQHIDFAPMDAAWTQAVTRLNYQGAAMVVDDSGVLWQRYNGSVDCAAEGRAIGPDDMFDTGSVTKIFTATLILRLIERGEFSFDTRLGDLLPDVPADKSGITVLQLLSHSSGLRETSSQFDEEYMARDAVLAQEFALPLRFAPGSDEDYSNVGYSVLTAIIERRLGRPYEEVMRRELLRPLRLDSIGYMHRPRRGADVCGWWDGRANPRYGSVRDYFGETEPSWHIAGNGALLSTPADLARFYHALMTGHVLGPESTALLQEHMARHWYGRDVYITNGSNIVFTSFIAYYRDTGLTFVMMSNDSRAPKERAMWFFNEGLNAVMDVEAPPP